MVYALTEGNAAEFLWYLDDKTRKWYYSLTLSSSTQSSVWLLVNRKTLRQNYDSAHGTVWWRNKTVCDVALCNNVHAAIKHDRLLNVMQ